jgi:hypothetical protein
MSVKQYRDMFPKASMFCSEYLEKVHYKHCKDIARKGGVANSKAGEGKTFEQRYGSKRAKELREKCRESIQKGWANPESVLNSKGYSLRMSTIKTGIPKTEKFKRYIRRHNSDNFKDTNFCKKWAISHRRKISDIEAITRKRLSKYFPKEWRYTGNFKFVIDGYNPDFINVNGKKACIEVFCDYYKLKKYDSIEQYKRSRRYHYGKFGWKVVFFNNREVAIGEEYFHRKMDKLVYC